jgi:hypothetical protein
MVFIESPIFTADVKELLSDEEYAALQEHITKRRARHLLPRRRTGADSDDPDLPQGHEGQSDVEGEVGST